ncbi:MAG TPA: hypothetical protein VJK90_11955 [Acetobacteraceae bacterium]|jgi:hypothetical protein|nr:hypothetical protein [Acetobacteraceae bacterium]
MKWLRKFWRLFVDEPVLATAVPFWCVLCALAAPSIAPLARATVLFLGLATSLAASVMRGARTTRAKM